MKIAIFTDTFLPDVNGVVTSVVNATRMLSNKGHKIYIFTSDKAIKLKLEKNMEIHGFKKLKFLKYPDFWLSAPRFIKCLKRIKKIKPDIIHVHIPSFLGYSAILCSKTFKIPLVATYHTLLPNFLRYLPLPKAERIKIMKDAAWFWTRRFYNRCDLVTTPSNAMKKILAKHRIKKPIKVLSNGVDTNIFKPKKINKTGKKLLHVGRMSHEKNIDLVLKAFKLVLNKKPNTILQIAGHGPELERFKDLTRKLKIGKNVKFLGVVRDNRLVNLYQSSDIFITASTIETEGIVVLEAMACGLPIVGVNALAVPEIVKHNVNGIIANPNNEKELADSTLKLLENKDLREKFGKESLKIVKEYDLNIIINKLEKIYKNLLS